MTQSLDAPHDAPRFPFRWRNKMKTLAALLLLISLPAVQATSAPAAPTVISPCSGVGPLPLPYSLTSLMKAWGPPNTLGNGVATYLKYGLAVTVDGDVVNGIAVFGDAIKYVTDKGISLGDSISRLHAVYGTAPSTIAFTPFWSGGGHSGTLHKYLVLPCGAQLGFVVDAFSKINAIILFRPSQVASPAPVSPAPAQVRPSPTTPPSGTPPAAPNPLPPSNDIGSPSSWPAPCLQPHPNDACLVVINQSGQVVDVSAQTDYYHACGISLTVCRGLLDAEALRDGRIVGIDPTQGTRARPVRLAPGQTLLLRLPKSAGTQPGPQIYYFSAKEPDEPSVWWLKRRDLSTGGERIVNGPYNSWSACEVGAPVPTGDATYNCDEQKGRPGRHSAAQITVTGGENKQWAVTL